MLLCYLISRLHHLTSSNTIETGCLERGLYGYCLVSLYDTTELPFVIDASQQELISNKGSVVQAVVWLFRSSLHITIQVYLLNCAIN